MITMKNFFEIINYRINSVRSSVKHDNVQTIYFYGNYASAMIAYDTVKNKVLYAKVSDISQSRSYYLFHEDYKHLESEVLHGNKDKSIVLETDNDFLEKMNAIIHNKEYDERVEFQIELSEAEELKLMRAAHQHDMSLNEFIEYVIINFVKSTDLLSEEQRKDLLG